jgi:hypothetical protein
MASNNAEIIDEGGDFTYIRTDLNGKRRFVKVNNFSVNGYLNAGKCRTSKE